MHRKIVTVVFCDMVGSTALGESTDPEALRTRLARYFERMKAIVERHGGSVEKFIGDAVMAVFGVPAVHEDDALRACRAAVEMRDAFAELGIQGRIGVNTGEVVTGTEERLATGDPVNVAARLQQAAAPNEVLIGEATLALVRPAVGADPVEPLELRGKSEPVRAYRLGSVSEAPERSHVTRFVGRKRELGLVREAWERALTEQRCESLTIVADAGIGKSRLAAEALAQIDARVVRGRCLSYGEGITYWPVVEALKQLGAVPSDPAAAAAIRSLLGQSDQGTSAEEIAWAFRRLLEEQAPLVVGFDDIQWGEETFLDLVESVSLLSAGAPILLVCLARPELLERRSHWPVAIRLEPLPNESVDELIGDLPDDLRRRVAAAAGGNPLFLTEMVAMAGERADVDVPPTLRALLATRLDQLEGAERVVLERGAVEGELFHRSAVQALVPDEEHVTQRLAALTRKELIRPDRAELPGDDGFRFRHLLIRDAAYDALPKSSRAELHERFADWLADRGSGLVELDEILGYHLEQAARYQAELGEPNPSLAQRAGDRLAAAGRRAFWRSDVLGAGGLFTRALELTRPFRLDVNLEIDFTFTVLREATPESAAHMEAVADQARASGDEAGAALADVVAAWCRTWFEEDPAVDELERLAWNAVPLLEAAGDHAGLVWVYEALGFGVANFRCQYEEEAQAEERALHHARLAGQRRTDLLSYDHALANGPRPADVALASLDAALPPMPNPANLLHRARLLGMLGRFDEAWAEGEAAAARLRELTPRTSFWMLAEIAWHQGDHERAVEELRTFCKWLESFGHRSFLSTFAPWQGRELCMLGRYDEAEPLARLGRELGSEKDVLTQMLWRQVQARVDAAGGGQAEAERLAREAVALGDQTDALNWQGDAYCDLAEVLAAAGKTAEAAAALGQALDRYERKKNLAMVAQVRPRLEALRAGSVA